MRTAQNAAWPGSQMSPIEKKRTAQWGGVGVLGQCWVSGPLLGGNRRGGVQNSLMHSRGLGNLE
jgi:hypothetical protein